MKIAFIVQRCGKEIIGGSESFTLNIAKKLSQCFEVEIITTCSLDYVTWSNYYPEGLSYVDGIPIRRFPTDFERNIEKFNDYSNKIHSNSHTRDNEILWMKMAGPYSSKLLEFLKENKNNYELFIFITHVYATTFFGLPIVAEKNILIPHADDDWSMKLSIFDDLYEKAYGIIYQTEEEKHILVKRFSLENKRSILINQGVTAKTEIPSDFVFKTNLSFPYLFYLGRIDASKGSTELIEFFTKYKKEHKSELRLVLAGPKVFQFTETEDVVYLGILNEIERAYVLQNCTIFIMSSQHESFSMATMEAWTYAKPVLANARSKVVKAHCEKSNGGLYYENYYEFSHCLSLLFSESDLRMELGKNGFRYVQVNYDWSKMIEKYRNFIIETVSSLRH